MNQEKINNFNRRYSDVHQKHYLNHIIPTNASKEHNKKTADICLQLYSLKIPFYSEYKTNRGPRLDVVIPEREIIIEILHTEKEEDCKRNKADKLKELKFIYVKSNKEVDIKKLI